MKNFKKYLVYTAVALAGILTGALLFGGDPSAESVEEHIAENHTNEQGEIIYTCSMHPQVRQNEPGNCPICGMQLIPAENSASDANPNELVMTPAAIKLAEIETSPVVKEVPVSLIRMPGKVVSDQNKTSAISAHIPGRIIDLYVDFEGDYVREGQRVASIYSPELISAQQELLETAKYKTQNPVLYQAARKKLELWELPLSTIDKIEASGEVMQSVDIVSPVSGYVQQISVQRQQHVMGGSLMYRVADLSSVWVMFDAFESQASFLRNGEEIQFTTLAYPGRKFSGTVNYIDPIVQDNSRAIRVRVEAKNTENRLKPNMLVEGVLSAGTGDTEQLLIPKSSVLWTGTRSVVFVQTPGTAEPTFSAREITLGQRVGDQYIVLEGLEEGELVVTNGTFKLDSAAQLADKLSMMNRTPGSGATQTGHEGHTMPMQENQPASAQTGVEIQDNRDAIPQAFKNQLQQAVKDYLSLKDALVASDPDKSSESAKGLLAALSKVDMSLLKGEAHMEWMRFLNTLKPAAESIAASNSVEQQRERFIPLSSKLIEIVKHFEVPGVYYQQFCPMSNNGEGAYWLSQQQDIANPYLGDQMHNCGETITKIEF